MHKDWALDEQSTAALQEHFGHSALRPAQVEALELIHKGHDCLLVMPTGTGKSLCYQLPGVMSPNLTLVISPLISLMKDQVDALNELGIAAAALNSSLNAEQQQLTLEAIRNRDLQFLYLAPERLTNRRFLAAIAECRVDRVAIDEAHCVSSWGHDFRPDYLRIGPFLKSLKHAQTLALTATATPQVRADIIKALDIPAAKILVTGFDRPNIEIGIQKARSQSDRLEKLRGAIDADGLEVGATIIYAASRKNVELAAQSLKENGHACDIYHAGLTPTRRVQVQEAFKTGRLNIVVATNAFGMGIDRHDVRRVIHFDFPGSIEAYYQEIGRAGRDGLPARAILIFAESSVRLQEFFIDLAHPNLDLIERVHEIVLDAAAAGCTANQEEIEAQLDQKVRSFANAAINRLIGLGVLARNGIQGELVHRGVDLDEVLNHQELISRRQNDETKLLTMLSFLRGRDCRRNFILDYFEAKRDGSTCGRCDACVEQPDQDDGRLLSGDEQVQVQKVLSGVARARGYAGKNKIAAMLTGARSKDVRGTWLEKLSTYGLLGELKKDEVVLRLEILLDAGLIEIQGDKYPTLGISAEGRQVLAGDAPPKLAWPESRGSKTSKLRPAAGASPGIASIDRDANSLREAIREWRYDHAQTKGIPPYRIFGDKTLDDLIRQRPRTNAELLEVHGFGPAKTKKFGKKIIELMKSALDD